MSPYVSYYAPVLGVKAGLEARVTKPDHMLNNCTR
jgi:hypothetical protein